MLKKIMSKNEERFHKNKHILIKQNIFYLKINFLYDIIIMEE